MMMFSFRAGSNQESASSEPRSKRAKISIACNVCKSKKTKCDGARPVCGPCSKKKHQNTSTQSCLYREVDVSSTPRPSTTDPEEPRTSDGRSNNPFKGNNDSNTSPLGPGISNSSLFGASGGLYIPDGIGNERDRRPALDSRRESTSQALPKELKQLPKLRMTGSGKEPSEIQFAIPPRKVADNLLALYWDYVDSAYPWLDRGSVEDAYESLWVKEGDQSMNERALHCILNLMFATACVAFQGQPPLSRYQSSVVFFDRAQELMSYEIKDLYNFEIIQMLLLTAVYLQHQKSPQKSFRNIGMAIHIAQELGLHIPATTEAMDDPHERDLARRVWNGCVIMDRICAMTFGYALKIPQTIAKEGLIASTSESTDGSESSALPSKIKFYASFCQLHYIIGEVLETFYISEGGLKNDIPKGNQGKSFSFDKIARLLRIESDLNDWASSLHPFFRKPSEALDTTPSKHVTREANVLRARYLSVRLLLFRPLLSQLYQQENFISSGDSLYEDDQLLPHIVLRCQLSCIRAAEDTIEFIAKNLPRQTQAYILPSNWYTVSYVYMAVTSLLAAKGSSQIVAHFSAFRLRELLQQARDILEEYEKHSTLSSRCNSVLRLIEQNLDRRSSVMESDVSVEGSRSVNRRDHALAQDGFNTGQHQPQVPSSNLDMIENYTFDWNDWPVFFSELDGEDSRLEGWGELPT